MMKNNVLFRLDDICEEMNYDNFLRLKAIFDRYEVKPLIGVIPKNEDDTLRSGPQIPEFWPMIRTLQQNGWAVAQHGYRHVYTMKKGGRLSYDTNSEFAGLSYDKQKEKIQKGKDVLVSNGIETDVFMAPSHSFDNITLKALRESGFRYISDGRNSHPYIFMGMTFVPCREYRIKRLNRFSCVCYHPNDIAEERYTETEAFLKKYRDRVITFEQAAELKPQAYAAARFIEILQVIYHKYLFKKIYHAYVYFRKKCLKV